MAVRALRAPVRGRDLYVSGVNRIEKVVWRGITYYRAEWQGVVRHARAASSTRPDGVHCGLGRSASSKRLTAAPPQRRPRDHLRRRSPRRREPPACPPRRGRRGRRRSRRAPPRRWRAFVEAAPRRSRSSGARSARDLVQIDGAASRSRHLRDTLAAGLAAARLRPIAPRSGWPWSRRWRRRGRCVRGARRPDLISTVPGPRRVEGPAPSGSAAAPSGPRHHGGGGGAGRRGGQPTSSREDDRR